MTACTPSAAQMAALDRAHADQPLALFYQYSYARPLPEDPGRAKLEALAREHGGKLIWAARGEQVLVGNAAPYEHACLFELRTRAGVVAFVGAGEHALALRDVERLEVAALNVQPGQVGLISKVLSKVLPHWPFDNTVESTDEPGLGTSSVMPGHDAVRELKAHPDQQAPVVMVNWLKFRPQAEYAAGAPGGAPVSGREAYYRYGRTALLATHSIGAKLIYACRYRQVLVGNGGDPGLGRWDEFALMQYPGRAGFALMTSLRRYRKALHHREAGLAEKGQSLTVTRPLDRYTWRG